MTSIDTLGDIGSPRFEGITELLIAGFNERYTYETLVNIPAQWKRFSKYIGKVRGQFDKTSYGVSWNRTPREFDYLSGVEVADASELPDGFSVVRIPPRRYAVFTHSGHVSTIAKTISIIYSTWLPNSGYGAATSPMFEHYTRAFKRRSGVGGIELWVPIE